MKYWIEAFDSKDQQILGNLDFQGSIIAIDPLRTKKYKALKLGTGRTLHPRVKFWRIVEDTPSAGIIAVIPNPHFKAPHK